MCGHHQHHDCGERHEEHLGQRDCGCQCSCHATSAEAGPIFWRRFATRDERTGWLQRYLEELRAEAQAVEERIAEMRAQ